MTDTDAQGRDDERISEIRDLAESYSGLQYVVTDPTRQWPWGSTLAVNEIIDIVRAVPELLAECKRLAGERDALAARLAQANDQVREILSMVASTDVPAGMEAQALRDIRAAFSAALAAADCRQVAGGD